MILLLSRNEADCLTSQLKEQSTSVNYRQAPNRRANYRASGLVQGRQEVYWFFTAAKQPFNTLLLANVYIKSDNTCQAKPVLRQLSHFPAK